MQSVSNTVLEKRAAWQVEAKYGRAIQTLQQARSHQGLHFTLVITGKTGEGTTVLTTTSRKLGCISKFKDRISLAGATVGALDV